MISAHYNPKPHSGVLMTQIRAHCVNLTAACAATAVSQRAAGYEHLPQNGPNRPDRTRAEGKQRLASGPAVVSTLPPLIAKSQWQGNARTHTHKRTDARTHT